MNTSNVSAASPASVRRAFRSSHVWRRVKEHRRRLLMIGVLATIESISVVLAPALMPLAVMSAAPLKWGMGLIGTLVVKQSCEWTSGQLSTTLGRLLQNQLRADVTRHAARNVDRRNRLDDSITDVTTAAVESVKDGAVNSWRLTLFAVVQFVSGLLVPITLAAVTGGASLLGALGLVAVGLVPTLTGLAVGMMRTNRERPIIEKTYEDNARLLGLLKKFGHQSLELLRFYGSGEKFAAELGRAITDFGDSNYRKMTWRLNTAAMGNGLTAIGMLLPWVLLVTGAVVAAPATVLSVMVTVAALQVPMRLIPAMTSQLKEAMLGSEKIEKVIRTLNRVDRRTPGRSLQRSGSSVEIELANVGYAVSGKRLIENVSFTYDSKPGLVAIVGVRGCGKSTLAQVMTGMLPFTDGEIWITSRKTGERLRWQEVDETELRDLIGYAPQIDSFDGDSTVAQLFETYRCSNRYMSPVHALLGLGFSPDELNDGFLDKKVHDVSGGQRRAIANAIALCQESPVVILDEPVTGADPIAAERIWGFMQHSAHRRKIIVVSHEFREVYQRGMSFVFLDRANGRQSGPSTVVHVALDPRYTSPPSRFFDLALADKAESPGRAWPKKLEVKNAAFIGPYTVVSIADFDIKRPYHPPELAYNGPIYPARLVGEALLRRGNFLHATATVASAQQRKNEALALAACDDTCVLIFDDLGERNSMHLGLERHLDIVLKEAAERGETALWDPARSPVSRFGFGRGEMVL